MFTPCELVWRMDNHNGVLCSPSKCHLYVSLIETEWRLASLQSQLANVFVKVPSHLYCQLQSFIYINENLLP